MPSPKSEVTAIASMQESNLRFAVTPCPTSVLPFPSADDEDVTSIRESRSELVGVPCPTSSMRSPRSKGKAAWSMQESTSRLAAAPCPLSLSTSTARSSVLPSLWYFASEALSSSKQVPAPNTATCELLMMTLSLSGPLPMHMSSYTTNGLKKFEYLGASSVRRPAPRASCRTSCIKFSVPSVTTNGLSSRSSTSLAKAALQPPPEEHKLEKSGSNATRKSGLSDWLK
mmetsp:Transcript_56759/g.162891  ORF Transcript_56759/g.162891 Transcript_56759/m.162891 type:complete len:228 (-) Transcript_56759:484-1167(-)